MKLQELLKVRAFIGRSHLEEIVMLTNKLKELEEDGKEVAVFKIPSELLNEFITAVSMLLEIQYYETSFINKIDFKIK